MKKSPLTQVKEQFGSKEKLVDALVAMPDSVIERGGAEKDEFRTKLLTAANAKLLRLHQTGSAVTERWGSKDKLVDAILTMKRRGKDQDYRTKLGSLTLGKLFDQFSSLERANQKSQARLKA